MPQNEIEEFAKLTVAKNSATINLDINGVTMKVPGTLISEEHQNVSTIYTIQDDTTNQFYMIHCIDSEENCDVSI